MTTFPQVNLNGDNIETLIGQYHRVYKQALLLRDALSKAAPHGRNFQTVELSRYSAAQSEWLAINGQIVAVQDWAESHVTELLRQAHERMSSQQVGEMCMRVMR